MKGNVILVGAGPGDPGLLTQKGRQALEQAEVVVYDRLVSSAILALIPHGAEAIDVGKESSRHLVPQEQINRILLEKAQAGKRVVRLKGGDPFLFGRGGEELELLAEQGIDFQVVPGVTSALSVPAYAGIPVTHRDFCSSLHIVTGHARAGSQLHIDFDALRRTGATMQTNAQTPRVRGLRRQRFHRVHQRRADAPAAHTLQHCKIDDIRPSRARKRPARFFIQVYIPHRLAIEFRTQRDARARCKIAHTRLKFLRRRAPALRLLLKSKLRPVFFTQKADQNLATLDFHRFRRKNHFFLHVISSITAKAPFSF